MTRLIVLFRLVSLASLASNGSILAPLWFTNWHGYDKTSHSCRNKPSESPGIVLIFTVPESLHKNSCWLLCCVFQSLEFWVRLLSCLIAIVNCDSHECCQCNQTKLVVNSTVNNCLTNHLISTLVYLAYQSVRKGRQWLAPLHLWQMICERKQAVSEGNQWLDGHRCRRYSFESGVRAQLHF